MRNAVIVAAIALISLGIFVGLVFRDRSVPADITNVKTDANTTIHLRRDLAVSVEVADTDAELIRGLSGSDPLPENTGMLFIFPEDGYPAIWMKDMRFAIDIIWINSEGAIVSIAPGVTPDTYPQTFKPAQTARYVLEVNAGYADARNLGVGEMTDIPQKFPPSH